MKRYFFLLLTVVVIAFSVWSCERDDICADGTVTTPRLVIEFYDSTNPEEIIETSFAYYETSVEEIETETSVTQAFLSLKTNEDSVTFTFILNGDDDDDTNNITDSITINYTREDIYISRACGYKTNFILTDVTLNSTNWIATDTIVQPTITNEDEVHLKIYY